MELYEQILCRYFDEHKSEIIRGEISAEFHRIVESVAYTTLENIKNIITDDSLSDIECFEKIERIVCEFERIGSSGGSRHDFG